MVIAEGRPYGDAGIGSSAAWRTVPIEAVDLRTLVTTQRHLDLGALLIEQSTHSGDRYPHVVEWHGTRYLEDGHHRAARAALLGQPYLEARVARP